jgi:transposase-like protein
MGEMEIPDELIDQLLGEYRGPEQLTGPEGLINELRKRLIERAAGAELERHLGYPPGAEAPEAQPNRRNGTTSKTLRTVDGRLSVELPRDRDASFEPRIVPKHARSFDGGARFWTSVLTELRNRGVKDVVFVCTDGLTGFADAIDAVFPASVNQTCIVHLVRQSLR